MYKQESTRASLPSSLLSIYTDITGQWQNSITGRPTHPSEKSGKKYTSEMDRQPNVQYYTFTWNIQNPHLRIELQMLFNTLVDPLVLHENLC
jgi:hypothetical protein